MTITHEEIMTRLRDEALDDRETGWLSDMGAYSLEAPERSPDVIEVDYGNGSIDLSHLASIVESLIEEAGK